MKKVPSELLRNSNRQGRKNRRRNRAYANVSFTAAIVLEIIFFSGYIVLFFKLCYFIFTLTKITKLTILVANSTIDFYISVPMLSFPW